MWRRFHFQSRAIDALNSSPGSPYGGQADSTKSMVANDKVVFAALGAFFGLMFLLFGIQIYVRCIWQRIQTEVVELEEETEEMARAEIYIREVGAGRRNWRRRLNHYFDERSESSSPAHQVPIGLDKSVLELLPTFVFNRETVSGDEMVCAVCLEEFVDGERGRLLPKCSHYFHVQCIDMWFLSHSSCPLCRCEVSLPCPGTVSNRLLRDSQVCPSDRSEQPQEPQASPPPSLTTERRDPVSTSRLDAENASIVGARQSNNALYLERGSSLSRRAAAIALEISDHECIDVAEVNQQMLSSGQQSDQDKLVMTQGSSSDNPSPKSRRPHSPPGPVLCLQYQPELHPSTSGAGAARRLEEDVTIAAHSVSIGSRRHARKRSYLAVEITDENQLDASEAISRIDSPSIHEDRLQPAG